MGVTRLTRLFHRDSLKAAMRSPLAWILCAAFVARVIGIGWGLPNSDGWDNDGVAPRDFLAGLVETFTPGSYYQYPPVHLVLLGLLNLPVILVALAKAKSFAPPDVIREVLKVPYMTIVAYVARGVSVFMSLGIVYAMAKIAEEIRGKRAAYLTAAVCSVNATLTYYAHTTNLDVPYLFWASLALLALARALVRSEPRRLRTVAIFAVLAIATKDQAYALFLASVPLVLVLWPIADRAVSREWKMYIREIAVAGALAAALLIVADAVVFNPTGFVARVHFLVGSASQDFALYSNDAVGRRAVFRDSFDAIRWNRYYPLALAPFAVLGVLIELGVVPAWRRTHTKESAAARVAALLPLFAALSFTLFFNCAARRIEHRFLMPQMVLWSIYAGIALEKLIFVRLRAVSAVFALAAIVTLGLALKKVGDVDANLVLDPRYDAEAWLRAHVNPGDRIETYGHNVYLPRFPSDAIVTRVGTEPANKRSPIPGITELDAPFGEAPERGARYLVVSNGWVWRYLLNPDQAMPDGRVLPPIQKAFGREPDGSSFFQALVRDGTPFKRVHDSIWTSKTWEPLDIHASTSREIWIFQRQGT